MNPCNHDIWFDGRKDEITEIGECSKCHTLFRMWIIEKVDDV